MASLPLPSPQFASMEFTASEAPAMPGASFSPPARLSPLEWSVVAMAERDGLASIRETSRFLRSVRKFFGIRTPNPLANERLETLRRVAVLAWHHGWNVPKSELARFLATGFTSDQFELIQNSLGQARAARRRRPAR